MHCCKHIQTERNLKDRVRGHSQAVDERLAESGLALLHSSSGRYDSGFSICGFQTWSVTPTKEQRV